jgi:ABC-type polysaccharide/polyol phosphate export permease
MGLENPAVISSLSTVFDRRDLLREITLGDLRSSANETRFGWVWWLIDPTITMLIYWAIVVGLFGRGGQYKPYPIFILCALLPFRHFGSILNGSCKLLRNKSGLIKAVPFPTMILPLSLVTSSFAFFLFGETVLLAAAWLWGLPVTPALAQLPLFFAIQIFLYTGVALMVSAFGALVRDLSGFMGHANRIFFYACPTLYGVDMVVERFTKGALKGAPIADILPTVYMMNPLAILFTGYRCAIFYGTFLPLKHWLVLSAETVVIFFVGFKMYQYFDRRVIKFL